ncbi:MAG: nucleoside recognition domain-containing protein [Christensenellales bacterium]|jgi:sporulation integral membrane protein YlbJ
MKKLFLIIAIFTMMILLLLYPENCLERARYGLNLWFTIVLPSLLPFMVASFILIETGVVRLISYILAPVTRVLFSAPGESAYVFFASAFSGYPVGAKLANELYEKKQITEADAKIIIRFTSVSGPVFITGAVSTGMLGLPEAGIYLAITHYLSALLTGIIFGLFNKGRTKEYPKISFKESCLRFRQDIMQCKPLSELLAVSVEKALMTLLKIGGLIIVFSVIMEMLSVTGILDAATWIYSPVAKLTGLSVESTKAMLCGSIEMTTGCSYAASLNINVMQKLSVISSIIAFGGVCIHMQTKAVLMRSGLKPTKFLMAKSIQAFLSYILCMVALSLFPMTISASNIHAETKTTAYYGLIFAVVSFAILLLIKIVQKNKSNKSILPFTRKL